MPADDTRGAIEAATTLLQTRLAVRTGLTVSVGHPEDAAGGTELNVFLYEALLDGHLRGVTLDEGRPPPLWLALRFLLTAFDDGGRSDTATAHGNLGAGLRALQELAHLPLTGATGDDLAALAPNPEPLKVTFLEASLDLISRVLQGSDERYRFSMAFELRPVMIATAEAPSYSLLVGVDYTAAPPTEIGEDAIDIMVEPTLGPRILAIEPATVAPGDVLRIRGEGLAGDDVALRFGPLEWPVAADGATRVETTLDPTVVTGAAISAGSHGVALVRTLPSGRKRSTNLMVVGLRPTLDDATPVGVARVTPADPDSPVTATIRLDGELLGTDEDDIVVALYRDGDTVEFFDEIEDREPVASDPEGNPDLLQTIKQFEITNEKAVPAGTYRIIVRVNGQQARQSPEVDLTP